MEELVDNHQDRHDEKVHGGDFADVEIGRLYDWHLHIII